MPALLNSTSRRPQRSSAAATARPHAAGSVTSVRTATARPPAPAMSAATRSPVCPSTSATTTVPPSRANASALARPIPEPAPVMRQILSARRTLARAALQQPRALEPGRRRGRDGGAAHDPQLQLPAHFARQFGREPVERGGKIGPLGEGPVADDRRRMIDREQVMVVVQQDEVVLGDQ